MFEPIPKPTKQPKLKKKWSSLSDDEREWLRYRKGWLKRHPANHQGYYTCGLCFSWVHKDDVTLDHIINRRRRPDLVYEDSNIQPAHGQCNNRKGSSDLAILPTPWQA